MTGSKEAASKWRSKNIVVLEVHLDKGTKLYQDRQANAVFIREKIPSDHIYYSE